MKVGVGKIYNREGAVISTEEFGYYSNTKKIAWRILSTEVVASFEVL